MIAGRSIPILGRTNPTQSSQYLIFQVHQIVLELGRMLLDIRERVPFQRQVFVIVQESQFPNRMSLSIYIEVLFGPVPWKVLIPTRVER